MLRGIVTQSNPTVILARVLDESGNAITQAEMSTISVAVYNAETSTLAGTLTPAVTDCIYDTLQLDNRWTADAVGFNLEIDVDGSLINAGDTTFQIQTTLTPVTGNPFTVVAVVKSRSVF